LNQLASKEPYSSALQHWKRESPVLDIENYANLLFKNGGSNITIFEKVYPLILTDAEAVYNWVSGTALIPYTGRLSGELLHQFIADYKKRLQENFPGSPVFYAFKRILMKAVF
jgi:trans-aconitate 2-methyltransferase